MLAVHFESVGHIHLDLVLAFHELHVCHLNAELHISDRSPVPAAALLSALEGHRRIHRTLF